MISSPVILTECILVFIILGWYSQVLGMFFQYVVWNLLNDILTVFFLFPCSGFFLHRLLSKGWLTFKFFSSIFLNPLSVVYVPPTLVSISEIILFLILFLSSVTSFLSFTNADHCFSFMSYTIFLFLAHFEIQGSSFPLVL